MLLELDLANCLGEDDEVISCVEVVAGWMVAAVWLMEVILLSGRGAEGGEGDCEEWDEEL